MKKGFNKRGQNIFAGVVVVLLVIFFGILIFGWIDKGSAEGGMNLVSSIFVDILGPLFKGLLGFDGTNDFMMVLAFLMAAIVVVSTLDSINIFGESKSGHLVNFFVGMIVAVIGVRFMPSTLWNGLSSPASAFIATILVGLPFLVMFFITMKIKSRLANKVIWLVYFAFLSYLIATGTFDVDGAKATMWIYIIFAFLSLVMLIFDASIRRIFYKERVETGIAQAKGTQALIQIQKLKALIQEYQTVIADPNSDPKTKADARKAMMNTEKTIRELSGLGK
ncbi:MAG: hypothetical protein NUV97_01130 [archaeon]|nr:hypothetical protein [archaeon]MCR4323435.1 hypothetical protein [Nanoarchaeota archaeon]